MTYIETTNSSYASLPSPPPKSAASTSSGASATDSPIQPTTPRSPVLGMGGVKEENSNNEPATLGASTLTNTSPNSGATTNGAAGQPKRKPHRRANTAERRATHNAVERARRETLNGRFLDLAALLPNLSQIRRPSKSAIVNSSIAHLHAARRHRLLAARELRLLLNESQALRRELNEWRDRSGLPRLDEPVNRGEGFGVVLSGEVEVLVVMGEDGEGGWEEDDEGDDSMMGASGVTMEMQQYAQAQAQAVAQQAHAQAQAQVAAQQAAQAQALMEHQQRAMYAAGAAYHHQPQSTHHAHAQHGGLVQPPSLRHAHTHSAVPTLHSSHSAHYGHPMIASALPATSYENPAMLGAYEPLSMGGSVPGSAGGIGGDDAAASREKMAAWHLAAHQQAQQAQSHLQQAQAQLLQQQHQHQLRIARGSPYYPSAATNGALGGGEDDNSSVGSFHGGSSPGSGGSPIATSMTTGGMVASPASASSFEFGPAVMGRRASVPDGGMGGMGGQWDGERNAIAVGGNAGFGAMGMMLAM